MSLLQSQTKGWSYSRYQWQDSQYLTTISELYPDCWKMALRSLKAVVPSSTYSVLGLALDIAVL